MSTLCELVFFPLYAAFLYFIPYTYFYYDIQLWTFLALISQTTRNGMANMKRLNSCRSAVYFQSTSIDTFFLFSFLKILFLPL